LVSDLLEEMGNGQGGMEIKDGICCLLGWEPHPFSSQENMKNLVPLLGITS